MIPADLPNIILDRGRRFRRADDREYRNRVAMRAKELVASLNTEAGKRRANAARRASRQKAAQ